MATYKIQRKKSQCRNCPLDGAVTHKCFGTSDTEKPELAIIGEAPGADEDYEGTPFVGVSGRFLKRAVDSTGHMWHKAHKTNIILCRPPSNDFTCPEAIEAVSKCRVGFIEELKELKKRGVWILLAVGSSPMKALSIPGTIMKSRGSVYMLRFSEENEISVTEKAPYDFICIPTFHPAFLLRGMLHHEVTFVNDIEKAYSFCGAKYQPPKENFNIFPTIQEIEHYTEEIINKKRLIAVDCETTSLVPGKGRIIVVGIATSSTDAFSIPFSKQGEKDYWNSPSERMRAHECLRKLMSEVPTMFQNSMFDMRHLLHFNAPVLKLAEDTMLLNHAISPELPHNIGYIVSIYGKTPYWKDEVLSAADRMINMDDEILRTYNLRDCVTLHQVINPMLREAKENKTLHIYKDISLPLVQPIIEMTERGMLLDKKALQKWARSLRGKRDRAKEKLRIIADLPESFNFNSGDHMRYLLFGIIPAQAERAKKEYDEYLQNEKKNRNTKKFREIEERVRLFKDIKPFKRLSHSQKKTESGSVSVDEDALLNVQIAANNRLSAISKIRRPDVEHEVERQSLVKLISFLDTYRTYAELEKLETTYTHFPTAPDGRVKFPYRITGTATGRMSSGSKKSGEAGNAQNIPKEARVIFVVPEGHVLIQGDYSNLELRVIAEVSNDTVLQKTFAQGLKVHDENVKLLFGLEKDDPLWDAAKRACKIYIFGRNYGGGLTGIYRKVVKAVPELNITYERFCQIDSEYRKAHPKYQIWYDQTVKIVSTERCLKNAFGRIRYFLGSPEEIVREGLNFPIQSTAADVLNMSIIRIGNTPLKAKLIASVHDSLVFEVPEKYAKSEAKKIKSLMEVPVKINGKDVVFPADMEIGKNWGTMKSIEL